MSTVGDLERHNDVDSQSGCIYTVPLLGSNRSSNVGILDGNCERHLDHNRILPQQSVSVRNERIRKYMRVPHRPKSGISIVMIVSGQHPINPVQNRGRSCHQKFSNRNHIASKLNK